MMKKLIALVLALVMCLSLCACGYAYTENDSLKNDEEKNIDAATKEIRDKIVIIVDKYLINELSKDSAINELKNCISCLDDNATSYVAASTITIMTADIIRNIEEGDLTVVESYKDLLSRYDYLFMENK